MSQEMAQPKRRPSLVPSFSLHKSKPQVDIILNEEQKDCFVPSYTTLEPISGHAVVTCTVDTPFNSVHITFQGTVRTFVEKLATSTPVNPRSSAFHTFLRLTQPIDDSEIPEGHILKAGITYKFSFTFVVPESLLPQACTHHITDHSVTEAHLSLPPSLGDPMMAGDGKTLLDDMSPDNARVSYAIRVLVLKKTKENEKPVMLSDIQKKIRILPAVLEAPPLDALEGNDDDYVLSATKSIRKGLFAAKSGYLAVEAIQPLPFYLPHPTKQDPCPPTTMATLELRFESLEANVKPPKLSMLNSRLKIVTFYSSVPLRSIPVKSNTFHYEGNRGIYVDTVSLASRCVEGVQWTKDDAPIRRDSAICLSRMATAASNKKVDKKQRAPTPPPDAPTYAASILIPLTLPKRKSFIPTFHSCLVSRIYLLDIVLTVSSGATGSNMHLKIPIQIASIGNPDARPQISPEEAAAIARREADGIFMPRSIYTGISPPESDAEQQDIQRSQIPMEMPHGARGSVFRARVGSTVEVMSDGEYDEPPSYTPHVRDDAGPSDRSLGSFWV